MRWFWQKKSRRLEPDLQYGDPTHAQFNAELAQRSAPPEKLRDLEEPWMKPDVLLRLPDLQPDFENSQNRDAAEREQKQVQQSKQGKSGRGSSEKTQDEPKPALKPKGDLRRKADQAAREQTNLAKIRDEVMKAAEAMPDLVSPSKAQERIHRHVKP